MLTMMNCSIAPWMMSVDGRLEPFSWSFGYCTKNERNWIRKPDGGLTPYDDSDGNAGGDAVSWPSFSLKENMGERALLRFQLQRTASILHLLGFSELNDYVDSLGAKEDGEDDTNGKGSEILRKRHDGAYYSMPRKLLLVHLNNPCYLHLSTSKYRRSLLLCPNAVIKIARGCCPQISTMQVQRLSSV
jgi:hypothetical protein